MNQYKDNKILLHMCCAPCSIIPLERLRSEGLTVEGLFFNPNIQPQTELDMRKNTLIDFSAREHFSLTVNDDMYLDEWLKVGANNPSRCIMCYEIRLRAAAAHAKKTGFDAFTTSLLISPYQNHELLTRIGREAGKIYGVEFVYKDFRDGFYEGQNKARELGLYRQKYCGCVFSLAEAEQMRAKRKEMKAAKASIIVAK